MYGTFHPPCDDNIKGMVAIVCGIVHMLDKTISLEHIIKSDSIRVVNPVQVDVNVTQYDEFAPCSNHIRKKGVKLINEVTGFQLVFP